MNPSKQRAALWRLIVLFLFVLTPRPIGAELFLNEFMADNRGAVRDPQGEADDWLEIYNAGPGPVDVGGMHLTDDLSSPTKHRLPDDAPASTTIPAGGFLVLWADGDVQDGPRHLPFALDADGEALGLFDASGAPLDRLTFAAQLPDISFGRFPDGGAWLPLLAPTPGGPNGAALQGVVAALECVPPRGFYAAPVTVALACPTTGVAIHYSTDGSEPTTASAVSTGAVTFHASGCLRARAFRDGWKASPIVTHSYLIGEGVAARSLPAICLVGDEREALYEPHGVMAIVGGEYDQWGRWSAVGSGDYNYPMRRGRAYERPVSVEFIRPADNAGAQLDCGLRVHGSDIRRNRYRRGDDWSRCVAFVDWLLLNDYKFSFRLYFRNDYGERWLEYPLIPNTPVTRLRKLVIRGGHNDSCDPFVKDELFRRLHQDMGHAAVLGTFCGLYINGDYKGYFNPCQRVDEDFLRERFNRPSDWDVVKKGGVVDGDDVAWSALLDYARTNDLASAAPYAEVGRRLDLDAFIDYLLLEIYSSNTDWPDNNWIAARERTPGARFRFFVWDMESTMLERDLYRTAFDGFDLGLGLNNTESEVPWLYRALKANSAFRVRFAERIRLHLFNGGALAGANVARHYAALRDEISGVLPELTTFPLEGFIPVRRGFILNVFADEGLFPRAEVITPERLRDHLLGRAPLPADERSTADVNYDRRIDAADLTRLIRER